MDNKKLRVEALINKTPHALTIFLYMLDREKHEPDVLLDKDRRPFIIAKTLEEKESLVDYMTELTETLQRDIFDEEEKLCLQKVEVLPECWRECKRHK